MINIETTSGIRNRRNVICRIHYTFVGYTGRAKGKERNRRKIKQPNKPKWKENSPKPASTRTWIVFQKLFFATFAVVFIKVNQGSTFFRFINSFPQYEPNGARILFILTTSSSSGRASLWVLQRSLSVMGVSEHFSRGLPYDRRSLPFPPVFQGIGLVWTMIFEIVSHISLSGGI